MAIDLPSGLQTYLPQSFVKDGQLTVSKEEAIKVASGIAERVKDMPEAQKAGFMALVNASDLTPTGGKAPADLDGKLDKLEQIQSVLGSLVSSSNTLDFLARAMIEQAGEQRKSKVEEGIAARQAAKGELLAQAGKLKESAAEIKSGAINQLIVTVVMSAVSIGMSMLSGASALKNVGSAAKAGGTAKEGLEGLKDASGMAKMGAEMGGKTGTEMVKQADKLRETSQATITAASVAMQANAASKFSKIAEQGTNAGQLANTMGQGLGNYFSQMSQANSKSIEAEGQEASANAQELNSKADVKKEAQQALDEMMKNIISFLKEMQDAKANQMSVLTRV